MFLPIWYGVYWNYLLFTLPALLLGVWAQWKVRSTFRKYSQIRTYSGINGAQVARRILDQNGLRDVEIEEVAGRLSDHYDPRSKRLSLSPEIFSGGSIAAAGVAAHEVGHALQDKQGYFPLQIRTAMVPTVQLGSWLGPIIFVLGLVMSSTLGTKIALIGIILFAATALFALVTLPVELDASRRAKQLLADTGMTQGAELEGVNKVLDAAALTYIAAAIQAISVIIYDVFLLTGRSKKR